ncbi:glutaredoxin [Cowpox virus]|uniref:Glutaredoxin-1 n=4 Tax=Orthopoxvirus TaxID=10242 RepID=GLRX1_CWPXG|nr:RecName: Full=Glutaredoxin-1 [Cowpox virus (strain GRI-90)]ABD97421.1 glutaredoxin [Cowpox virus]AHB23509.1 glutaredoxin thiol-transferase [Vaccinia virus WAU86/88-1]AIZ72817.1 glutaredoxin [Vaccinia virus]ADZ24078.1 glutaredoxin [Cowpox virus]ADZ29191.1 glutaredoxin [Cowpox virus]
MAEEFVQQRLANNKVTIFVKFTCPFCRNALDILNKFSFKRGAYEIVDIKEFKPENELRDYFEQITGGRTVPRIFFGKTSIGGYSDLLEIDNMDALGDILSSIGVLRTC